MSESDSAGRALAQVYLTRACNAEATIARILAVLPPRSAGPDAHVRAGDIAAAIRGDGRIGAGVLALQNGCGGAEVSAMRQTNAL